eukprot:TRINITY_DN3349_c0_g1_i1.p1 TRINITY_DN3349_c0_g1~~TRINITY_DN3349_c0_g1_i1.p1  ORF type:complete len:183 (+),score=55.06 TRINITY_DN3349_c0_g1_i1:38-586(+)
MEEVAIKNPWADYIYAEDIRSKMKVPDKIILGASGVPTAKKEESSVKSSFGSRKQRLFAPSPPPPSGGEALEDGSPQSQSSAIISNNNNNTASSSSSNGIVEVTSSPLNNSVSEISRETYKPEIHGSPLQEIQLLRKQVAKMNHRLMAVELQNQQQSQRELLLTGCVSAFILFKIINWLSRV